MAQYNNRLLEQGVKKMFVIVWALKGKTFAFKKSEKADKVPEILTKQLKIKASGLVIYISESSISQTCLRISILSL